MIEKSKESLLSKLLKQYKVDTVGKLVNDQRMGPSCGQVYNFKKGIGGNKGGGLEGYNWYESTFQLKNYDS